jgi:hypothetical protein
MDKKQKAERKTYKSPVVIPLGELAKGAGYCEGGSGEAGNCTAGSQAGGYCQGGLSPTMI